MLKLVPRTEAATTSHCSNAQATTTQLVVVFAVIFCCQCWHHFHHAGICLHEANFLLCDDLPVTGSYLLDLHVEVKEKLFLSNNTQLKSTFTDEVIF